MTKTILLDIKWPSVGVIIPLTRSNTINIFVLYFGFKDKTIKTVLQIKSKSYK